jgi:hypothetical protein
MPSTSASVPTVTSLGIEFAEKSKDRLTDATMQKIVAGVPQSLGQSPATIGSRSEAAIASVSAARNLERVDADQLQHVRQISDACIQGHTQVRAG